MCYCNMKKAAGVGFFASVGRVLSQTQSNNHYFSGYKQDSYTV